MTKRIARRAIQVVAAGAGLAFILSPVTHALGMGVFAASILVLLVCLFLWLLLLRDEGSGYWPDDNKL